MDPVNIMPNMKLAALSVPGIIGGTQKIEQPLFTPTLHFLQIFYWLLFAWTSESGCGFKKWPNTKNV